ncbi:beta-ketoacyl-ACP synthase [Mangrovimicrobium sediminis]|uniref:Beta-ketoacyl-ACP synthase n=1 Tax=Mangrovimicrobium sediminis TaxID=2562682 RepID=A0A4Z0LZU0_9GAMM|nr:beta-ketoacyl-ACP synthase [Haliea sp. SAOS-164]TGD72677.1 beta-ketoacyl-ACP synthase [Haliea sp. SAOS-164]
MYFPLLDYESTTGAWLNSARMRTAIASKQSGLRPNDLAGSDVPTWIGRVAGVESLDLGPWASRNNALAQLCLAQGTIRQTVDALVERHGSARVGLVLGSSTSSIDRTEAAYRELDNEGALAPEYRQPLVHNPHALGLFVAQHLGLTGPVMTINTACSSSAKIFATAARWLQAGFVDAVLVGGADSLCLSVVHGFHALQLVSTTPCRPFDAGRDGINLGEGAGFAVVVGPDHPQASGGPALTGYGESSDAHHMSHPHPEGEGARQSITQALQRASLAPAQIDYINLHGTASQANDLIEGRVVEALFPASTVCSSTKGWTGHTLGAAGITEAIIAIDTLCTSLVPASLNLEQPDPALGLHLARDNQARELRHVMTNSFGFGGNNCSLVFSSASGAEAPCR